MWVRISTYLFRGTQYNWYPVSSRRVKGKFLVPIEEKNPWLPCIYESLCLIYLMDWPVWLGKDIKYETDHPQSLLLNFLLWFYALLESNSVSHFCVVCRGALQFANWQVYPLSASQNMTLLIQRAWLSWAFAAHKECCTGF